MSNTTIIRSATIALSLGLAASGCDEQGGRAEDFQDKSLQSGTCPGEDLIEGSGFASFARDVLRTDVKDVTDAVDSSFDSFYAYDSTACAQDGVSTATLEVIEDVVYSTIEKEELDPIVVRIATSADHLIESYERQECTSSTCSGSLVEQSIRDLESRSYELRQIWSFLEGSDWDSSFGEGQPNFVPGTNNEIVGIAEMVNAAALDSAYRREVNTLKKLRGMKVSWDEYSNVMCEYRRELRDFKANYKEHVDGYTEIAVAAATVADGALPEQAYCYGRPSGEKVCTESHLLDDEGALSASRRDLESRQEKELDWLEAVLVGGEDEFAQAFLELSSACMGGEGHGDACTNVDDCKVGVYRSWNDDTKVHLYTNDDVESEKPGFSSEIAGDRAHFSLLRQKLSQSMTEFYRCRDDSSDELFYTISANCEGHQLDGFEGFIATSQMSGTAPLYRLHNALTDDRLYTTSGQEKNIAISQWGYTLEGIEGYVWPVMNATPNPDNEYGPNFCAEYGGKSIGLRTSHGSYLRADDGGVIDQADDKGSWEQFTVECLEGGDVALRTHHGLYVQALPASSGNGLQQSDTLSTQGMFRPQPQPGGIWAFGTAHDGFVSANEDGSVSQSAEVGSGELFSVED